MGRQRMVRPDLFIHEDLFTAEKKACLPLRLAFIGLWTQCDREGRFLWRPSRLKLAILPWDDVDFADVLDALGNGGFVTRYENGGKEFGHIPSWHRHQKPHHQEAQSVIPPPASTSQDGAKDFGDPPNGFTPSPETAPTISREDGDGFKIEIGDGGKNEERKRASADCDCPTFPADFETFWNQYPRKIEKRKAAKAWQKRLGEGTDPKDLIRAAVNYAASCTARKTENRFIKHPATFLGPDRPYEDWLTAQEENNNGKAANSTHRYAPENDPYANPATVERNGQ